MAVDALEYDESAEDANPAGALEEILENPERLKDLDLDAFAEELERQVGSYESWQARTLLKQLCGKELGQQMFKRNPDTIVLEPWPFPLPARAVLSLLKETFRHL